MTSREAFRLGFLARCAEDGLPPEEVGELVKSALLEPVSTAVGALGGLGGLLTAGALAIPPALGYGAGAVAAKATDPDYDVEDLKKQELIEEYRRLANRARRAAQLKKLEASPA